MTMTQIQLFSLPVTDQDRAKAFYVDTLGFELVADTEMGPGQRWVQGKPSGGEGLDHPVNLVRHLPTPSAPRPRVQRRHPGCDISNIPAPRAGLRGDTPRAPPGRLL